MDKLFDSILVLSWQAGVIALAVMGVRLLLRKKASRRALCLLWALVALRLVLPVRFTIESPVSLQAEETPVNRVYHAMQEAGTSTPSETVTVPAAPSTPSDTTAVIPASPAAQPGAPGQAARYLPWLWITGMGIMAVYMLLSLLRMRLKLRRAAHMEDNVYRCTQWNTPFVLGIIAPRIYVPESVSPEDLPQVLAHERCHIRRWDHIVKPLAFLLLHAYIIYAPALMIALFVLPHMIHASLTNSKIQGKYRHSFWSEIYETVLAWYIAPPTLVALINPHKGKFNVTAKGGLVEEEYVDWVISRPYIFLVLLNLVGVAVGIWRYFYGPPTEMLTVVVSMVWVFYNLIVLGGAVAVSVESKQVRRSHRVEMTMPAAIAREDGHLFSCTVQDFSDGGLGIKINGQAQILEGQKVNLLLKRGQQEYVFPTQVARVMGNEVGLKLMPLTTQQHIDFVQCTFARADTWALWQDSYPEDKPLESLLDILKLGFRGYRHLAEFAPSSVKGIFRVLTSLVSWVVSFIPRRPERSETAQPSDQALAQQ